MQIIKLGGSNWLTASTVECNACPGESEWQHAHAHFIFDEENIGGNCYKPDATECKLSTWTHSSRSGIPTVACLPSPLHSHMPCTESTAVRICTRVHARAFTKSSLDQSSPPEEDQNLQGIFTKRDNLGIIVLTNCQTIADRWYSPQLVVHGIMLNAYRVLKEYCKTCYCVACI